MRLGEWYDKNGKKVEKECEYGKPEDLSVLRGDLPGGNKVLHLLRHAASG